MAGPGDADRGLTQAMALALALLLLVVAVTAILRVRPDQMSASRLWLWWAPSWIGQTFALPGVIVAGLLAISLSADAPRLTAAAASIVFLLVHWRNRRDGLAMMRATGSSERLPLTAGLWPFNNGSGTVRTQGIAYGDAGERNTLDLVAPVEKPHAPMPVLIHVPGGAWVLGRRNQQGKPLLHHMARHGWLCLDINYRLGPKSRFPAMLTDVLRAIAWAKAHAAEHGGNPARIAVTGGSAGGHLTALSALHYDDPKIKPGFEAVDCSISAAVPCYGRYDFINRLGLWRRNHEALQQYYGDKVMSPDADAATWDLASPIAGVRGDAPPMLVIHGRQDSLLASEEAEAFVSAQRAAGGRVDHLELSGGQHGYEILRSAAAEGHSRAVRAWLEQRV